MYVKNARLDVIHRSLLSLHPIRELVLTKYKSNGKAAKISGQK
jgi:hypothetical protein